MTNESVEYYVAEGIIGRDTPEWLQIAMANFLECLLNVRYIFPAGKYKMFEVTADLGCEKRSYGDSSGGHYTDTYRTLQIEYNGKEETVLIGVLAMNKDRTSICVAIDNGETDHHSLQLNVDVNIKTDGDIVDFNHNGIITISNLGRAKISEFYKFMKRNYPEFYNEKFHNGKIFLGSLKNNRPWNISDDDVVSLLENLISYALIRDEYREYYINQKSGIK